MILAILLLLGAALGSAETSLEAVWKRPLRPDRQGTLSIGEEGLAFQPRGAGRPGLAWAYEDIQHLDRGAAGELAILSYEEGSWVSFGRDRRYRFALAAGTLPDALFARLAARVGRPATDRASRVPAAAEWELPAKRMARLGASEGTLYLTREALIYVSPAAKQSRRWLLDRDLDSVWSADPYRLEVHAFEGREGALRRPKVYRFALKRPLPAGQYRRLKLRFFDAAKLSSRLR